MRVELGTRTAETVAVYFERAQQDIIRRTLPQKAQTLDEALRDYEEALRPDAESFGRTILADGAYVGDVWCCCIDKAEESNAMLSYCVFETSCWGHGIASEAVALILAEVRERYNLRTVGAFTYADNEASIRVLEKNGFSLTEDFFEDGKWSKYFQREL